MICVVYSFMWWSSSQVQRNTRTLWRMTSCDRPIPSEWNCATYISQYVELFFFSGHFFALAKLILFFFSACHSLKSHCTKRSLMSQRSWMTSKRFFLLIVIANFYYFCHFPVQLSKTWCSWKFSKQDQRNMCVIWWSEQQTSRTGECKVILFCVVGKHQGNSDRQYLGFMIEFPFGRCAN